VNTQARTTASCEAVDSLCSGASIPAPYFSPGRDPHTMGCAAIDVGVLQHALGRLPAEPATPPAARGASEGSPCVHRRMRVAETDRMNMAAGLSGQSRRRSKCETPPSAPALEGSSCRPRQDMAVRTFRVSRSGGPSVAVSPTSDYGGGPSGSFRAWSKPRQQLLGAQRGSSSQRTCVDRMGPTCVVGRSQCR
jgi:hypothetical protein